MAVNEKSYDMSATSRRLFFGTNVFIVVVLLVALVAMINFVVKTPRFNRRLDLSAGASSYRLSERTQNIVKQTQGDAVRITTVYTSDEPEYSRKAYFPRVRDLCGEIAQYDRRVKVDHLYSPADKVALRERIQGKFGSVAEKHTEVLTAAKTLWDGLPGSLGPVQANIDALLKDDSAWLGGFSSLAGIGAKLKANLESAKQAQRDVEDLTGGKDAMPRFQEATNKVKEVNDQIKQTLESTQKWCKDTNGLVAVLSNKDSEFAAKTHKQLEQIEKLLTNLANSVGDPADTSVPDDPKPMIVEFGKASGALARVLGEEVNRVNAFVKANPMIEQHPRWMLNVSMGPFMAKMPLSANLGETAQSVSENVQAVRQVLSAPEVQKDQLQTLLRQLRGIAANLKLKIDQEWKANILDILDDGAKIDAKSTEFLARGSDGTMFKEILDKVADISKKIEDLPKLELDEIAERLQDENLVIVEAGDQVRVVKFDEVWPIADPSMRFRGDDKQTSRVFDGDGAIASALLAMSNQKKFATVIFVAYETEGNPMARRMGQQSRNTGRIPLDQLNTLKDKLKQANFAVKDWNLGAEGPDGERPQPEEGTEAVYVFLPPAEAPPQNPMMGMPPEKGFGEEQLAKIRPLLTAGSKAMFLATWEIPRMMHPMMPPQKTSYAYAGLLKDDYGVEVHQDYRLLGVVPDNRDRSLYGIEIEQVGHLQLSSFTDHPIGAPLRARRMLMNDVCPVTKAKEEQKPPPQGVSITTILDVPVTSQYIWAFDSKGIEKISDAFRTGENRSQFKDDEATTWKPPFSVGLAIEKAFGENEAKSRVVVLGTAASLPDYHLTRRVPRFSGEGKRTRFLTDPPPTENAELFVNAALWLAGKDGMIAAGPSQIPLVPALKVGTKQNVFVVTMAWAAIVLVAGIAVMFVRSK